MDWSGVPSFPRTGEFCLAEVRFSVGGNGYKAALTSISGHIFDFRILPSPKAIAFANWDSAASARKAPLMSETHGTVCSPSAATLSAMSSSTC